MGDSRTDLTGETVLRKARVSVPLTDLRRAPDHGLTPEMQTLYGESVDVLEETGTWARVAIRNPISDDVDYIGWVEGDALSERLPEPTHRVSALRAPVFTQPDLKTRILRFLPLGARIAASGRAVGNGGEYVEAARGFVSIKHLVPLDGEPVEDFVDTAERLQDLPYVWGGDGPDGMDCSGLVRMSLHSAGIACPRDADQQEAALGKPFEPDPELMTLRRGDLVFWQGHVGIMQTSGRLLHANAHHMRVATEPLREAVERIGPIRTVKRL